MRKSARLAALGWVCLLAGPASAKDKPVPFHSDMSAIETLSFFDPRCPETPVTAYHTATGVATHLGAFTAVMSDCIDITRLATEGVLRFDDGQSVMTAADGDELHATYHGDGFISAYDPDTGCTTYSLVVFQILTGGTGRFAGASGSATGSAVVMGCDTTTWVNPWQNWMSGDITY